ncbi:MAG: GTPase HflX [Aureispira sp.]|nr:GTPase HflX [Aureispira sp.]
MANEWNVGEKKRTALAKKVETAVIVGIIRPDQTDEQVVEHLDELDFLASTAGAKTLKRFVQRLKNPNSTSFVGKGKVEEVREYVEMHEVDLVIFDDDLTGKQTNFLEEVMKCKILDRSSLILDIFANRAQTAQAKTQVELAQMQYLLPRLRGLWTHLERQRGGIGMRGPGEKEIETDRRIVRDKISLLKQRLAKIDAQARTQRKNRSGMIRVSLAGYTNAGKSTLMNVLGKAEVLAENKLFATLDTTVRKVVVERMPFLLSDTVGFIRKLPHHLIESFKSTLDEVRESDLIVHVVDISHPQHKDHIEVVQRTLKELGAGDKPVLYVFNKMDLYRKQNLDEFLTDEERNQVEVDLKKVWEGQTKGHAIFISALKKEGLMELRSKIKLMIEDLYMERYPHRTKFW